MDDAVDGFLVDRRDGTVDLFTTHVVEVGARVDELDAGAVAVYVKQGPERSLCVNLETKMMTLVKRIKKKMLL